MWTKLVKKRVEDTTCRASMDITDSTERLLDHNMAARNGPPRLRRQKCMNADPEININMSDLVTLNVGGSR